MKVHELQQKLSTLDPNMEVICYRDDDTFRSKKFFAQIFGIVGLNIRDAEKIHLEDGTPYLKFGKSAESMVLAILEVTSHL